MICFTYFKDVSDQTLATCSVGLCFEALPVTSWSVGYYHGK